MANLLHKTGVGQKGHITIHIKGSYNASFRVLIAPVSQAFGGAMALVSAGGKGQSRTKLP